MSAGGRANHCDPSRISAGGTGLGPQGAQAAGGVAQHGGVVVAVLRETIIENGRMDAALREPARVAGTFVIGMHPVASARQHEHARASGLSGLGWKMGEM